MIPPQALLVQQISSVQDHVLAAVDGVPAEALLAPAAPSGWCMAGLVSHLTYGVEIFWVHAILAARDDAIAEIGDGWSADVSDPQRTIDRYRRAVTDSRNVLADVDLTKSPAWWPPEEVFPWPAYESGWDVAVHLLVEVSTHAGHLDMARERIDGHLHLALD